MFDPHNYRVNLEEMNIYTFKNHFVGDLYTTDNDLPTELWDCF